MLKAMTATTTMKKANVVENANSEDEREATMIKVVHVTDSEDVNEIPTGDTGEGREPEDHAGAIRGLLDSGASHALKEVTQEEYDRGLPIKVTLAGEDTKVLRQNVCGTVMVTGEGTQSVQPIVPMGALVEDLGCSLQWNKGALKLRHPTKGFIKVYLNNNCPEIDFREAHKLIKELENKHLAQLNAQVSSLTARLEVLRKEENRSWDELLREYVKTGSQSTMLRSIMKCPFTSGLPTEVQSMVAEGFELDSGEKYLKELPLNKRKRKALLNSNAWVVHMFAGGDDYNTGFVNVISKGGKIVLDVHSKSSKQWDVHGRQGVYRLLLWAASKGKVTDVIGSPPQSTWSSSITAGARCGNSILRTVSAPYGQQPLQPLQQHRVDQETACVAKQMMVWMIATIKGPGVVGFFMDFPQDPDLPEHASFWSTEMWRSFRSIGGHSRADFHMGVFGHQGKRPTTAGTNYPEISQLDGCYAVGSGFVPPSMLRRSEFRKWPPDFGKVVADAVLSLHGASAVSDQELYDIDVKVSKLTKEQRLEWKKHLRNDHQPYRSDCSVCINAQATGYQHKRRRHPSMYTLAIDLAGPFKRKGKDMDFDDYKYIMVGAYRCPKNYLSAMELDPDVYVPDDDDLPHGEDPMEIEEEEKVSGGEEPPEDEASSDDGGAIESEVEELTKKVKHGTVYVARCLRRRTGPHVLQAAKEILLQLRQSELHVATIHTDRAREFKSKAFKAWVNDEKIRHSRTAGGDPAANSTAELGVKWAKARVRALLKSGRASPNEWPMAIDHATAQLWSKAFPHSPWTNAPAVAFGSEVWYRAKAYKGKREKGHDPDGTRWKKGLYRGPTRDVSRGHLILRGDGGLTIAKGIKFNIIDPDRDLQDLLPSSAIEGDSVIQAEIAEPPSRAQIKEEIEFMARKAIHEKNFTVDEVIKIYEKLEELGDTDFRTTRKSPMTSWFSGAFVHGGKAGLRSNTKEYPMATRFLTMFARRFTGDKTFSAIGVARNTTLGMHRDSHNARNTMNMVLPLTDFEGGDLWVCDPQDTSSTTIERELPIGQRVKGKLLELSKENLVEFNPSLWHEVQPWKGDRLVLLAYTPRASKLQEDLIQELKDAGFVIGKEIMDCKGVLVEEEEKVEINKIEVKDEVEQLPAFVEFDEWKPEDHLSTTPDQFLPKALIKKSEVQYTQNIEQVLRDLRTRGEVLEVTHTVSLADVKKNLSEWYDSAVKEYTNLKDKKKAFKVTKRWNLPDGCKIVPCKGVFTVKPEKHPNLYKRKTRFVACGNHVPEGSMMPEGFDLFAAGLDATSLRTMFAHTAGKDWLTGTTDIRQAFVLAPWLGVPVALQPPAIAFELGLAEQGDMWEILMSIYGLRESPALWSGFRDQELRGAVWETEVNGKLKRLKLQQLVSDDQVWKVVDAEDPQDALGYIMVYIDDLLITSPPDILYSFFDWVSNRWEVDDLNVLEYDHPIRFLGMELHKVPGGVELAQEGFIKELLRSYGHSGSRSWSQGSRETLVLTAEEEEAIINAAPASVEGREAEVKQAQKRVGEMLWLTGRSRPDIQYITSLMSSRITRAPDLVNQIGDRLLNYLAETQHYRLSFVQGEEDGKRLDVFTDSSFATSSGRSHGCAAVFWRNSPIAWRSARQQLVTLSTAESELLEAVEGTILGLSTQGLLQELNGQELPLYLHVDNQAAISLLGGSSASWRTRHLRLRSNWVREGVTKKEIFVLHEPGITQRADIGTKPLTKDRLKQLVQLWGIVDRRPVQAASVRGVRDEQQSWLMKLIMLCQVCGSAAENQGTITTEVPWDLYLVVAVLAIAVIGLWEGFKFCLKQKEARLRALRNKANKTILQKLSKAELKELQRLLAIDPEDLNVDQRFRLVELRTRFEATMPANTSPVPTIPSEMASSSSGRNKQPSRKDQGVQATPAFERVDPEPIPQVRVEMYAGPFFQVPGRDTLHLFSNCWGLRHAGRTQNVQLCRCCTENAGKSLYDRR